MGDSDGSGIQNQIFSGTQNQPKNGFMACWIRLIFILFPICGIFDDFSKLYSAFNVLHFKIWQKMKKRLVQLAINPFFNWLWVIWKCNFGYILSITKLGDLLLILDALCPESRGNYFWLAFHRPWLNIFLFFYLKNYYFVK